MPVRISLTAGTVADCTELAELIEGIEAQFLLADRAYDTDAILALAQSQETEPVIPPKKNRKQAREYDQAIYELRHLVENGFPDFKQWRAVATRYAKRADWFLAICQIRAMFLWTKLI